MVRRIVELCDVCWGSFDPVLSVGVYEAQDGHLYQACDHHIRAIQDGDVDDCKVVRLYDVPGNVKE